MRTLDPAALPSMAAAGITEAGVDPVLTLALGLMTLLGLTIAPVAVALINRGGKSKVIDPSLLPPDIVMPRRQYDELLDQFARADDENDRLHRENTRLREQLDHERVALALARVQLGERQ